MEEELTVELCREVIEQGYDPYQAIMKGLSEGMSRAGDSYNDGSYYIPELLLCSDAMYAGLDVLKPHIQGEGSSAKGKCIIGVVQGDIHDIGKNLVKTMLEAEGWLVYDLGKDVEVQKFAEKQNEIGADCVAISALMTTSMLAMPMVINRVKSADPSVLTIVGGAPLTEESAREYGADGYADNAKLAVKTVADLLEERTR
jgi:methanogenic corrinoid protein MtbC1